MKRICMVLMLCSFLFTACSNAKSVGIIGGADGPTEILVSENNSSVPEQTTTDAWSITLSAEHVTPTGLTLKIEQSGGNPSGELQTGAAFFLETCVNDMWRSVETKTGKPLAWNAIAYSIQKNDVTEMNIDWSYAYGELPPGRYRLKKEITDFRSAGDYDVKTYAVYFTIQ